MKFSRFRFLVFSDLYRIRDKPTLPVLVWYIFFRGGAFPYIFWLRTCSYAKDSKIFKYTLYPIARMILNKLSYRLGISIPYNSRIGSGFYIGHFGGIVVNSNCVIGNNCNISHGVTLGQGNRGNSKGVPHIGDNVYIGPGAKIFGGLTIGNNAAIGANCVVTKNVPDNAVVVGVPGKIISFEGSTGYVNRTDYLDYIN